MIMKANASESPPKLKRFILSQVQKQPTQNQVTSNKNGPPFKKSKWTPEEDQLLIESVNKNGMGNWSLVCLTVPGRSGKQCRERWINQLCPELNRHSWDPQEDAILIRQHNVYGNFWTKIAQFLPGRSANNIKNRWSWLSRHLVQQNLFSQNISMFLLPHKQNSHPMCVHPGPDQILQTNSQICPKSLLPTVIYPIQRQDITQQQDLKLGFPVEKRPGAIQLTTFSNRQDVSTSMTNLSTDNYKQKSSSGTEIKIQINLPTKYVELEKT